MIGAGWWLQSGGETEVLGCGGDGEAGVLGCGGDGRCSLSPISCPSLIFSTLWLAYRHQTKQVTFPNFFNSDNICSRPPSFLLFFSERISWPQHKCL